MDPEEDNKMRVLVETMLGTSFEVVAAPEDNVYLLKCKILRKLGIPVAQQHLVYNLVELTNSENLSSYSIKDGSVLKLLISLKNGLIADCGRTLSTLDHIQWTELKYFLENRDESMEWLHVGCKGLMIDDDDDDFITHFLLDAPKRIFLPGIPLTEEDCVTKCKMIDVQSRMRELSIKRYEKQYQNLYGDSDDDYLKCDCPCGQGDHLRSMLSGVPRIYREAITRKKAYESPIRKLPNINHNNNNKSEASRCSSNNYDSHSSDTSKSCDDNADDALKRDRVDVREDVGPSENVNNPKFVQYKNGKDSAQKGFLPPIDIKVKEKGKRYIAGKTERLRCLVCKKRLSIATIHNCQCGGVFCAPHRYLEVHNCQHDYSKEWLNQLQKANPPHFSFPKLPKI